MFPSSNGFSASRGWAFSLWALALLGGVIGVIIFALTGDRYTSAAHALRFLLGSAHIDSWRPMILAIEHLRAHPDIPLYTQLFFAEKLKFQYPISSLLVPDLLQRVSGATWQAIIGSLNRFSWCFVWLTGIVSWRLFVNSLGRSMGSRVLLPGQLSLLWPCLVLTITFYPIAQSYVLGQVQTTLTLFAALALLAWGHRQKRTAGMLVGFICAVKPQWAILLLWGALRRQWGMVAAGAATLSVLVLAAGLLYGFRHLTDYFPVLSYLSRHGEGYFPNQSMNGLMNRLLFNGNNLQWVGDAFPDFHPLVYAVTLLAAGLLLIPALLYRRRQTPGVCDLALVILSMTMAAPIAWEHHYGVLLPIFAVLAPVCVAGKRSGRLVAVWLLLAFLLASQRLDIANRLSDTWLNVLQSYLFFAAAAVLAILYRCSGEGNTSPPTTPTILERGNPFDSVRLCRPRISWAPSNTARPAPNDHMPVARREE